MIPIRTSVELREAPGAVIGLIIANVAIFLLEIGLPADLAKQFIMHNALVPARYTQIGFGAAHGLEPANVFPFITNAFMHSGWWHLTINMWTLWLFGGPLEQQLGAARFVLFYLGCGVAASVAHFTFNLASPVPALGASGAIAGVLGGFTLLHLRERVLLLTPLLLFPVTYGLPASIYTILWFAQQILAAFLHWSDGELKGGIAWWAHIGGFVVGLVIVRFFGTVRHKPREIGEIRSAGIEIGSRRPSVIRLGSSTLESGRLIESRPQEKFLISTPREDKPEPENPWRIPEADEDDTKIVEVVLSEPGEDDDNTLVIKGPWHRPGMSSGGTPILKVPWSPVAKGGGDRRPVIDPWSRRGNSSD